MIEGHNAIRVLLPKCLPTERTTYMTIREILMDERVKPKVVREETDPLKWSILYEDISIDVEHIQPGGTYRLCQQ